MLTRDSIIRLCMFVLQFPVKLTVLAAVQSLVMRIGMHLIQFFVIVIMTIIKPIMPLIVLIIILVSIGALR